MALTIIDKTTPTTADLGTVTKSLFLAGPCPRGEYTDWKGSWHNDAVRILQDLGFDGHVFIPLPFSDLSYSAGVAWEEHFLELADHIVFWVPRSEDMPGFTTNVEFGEYMRSNKASLGYPDGAVKTRYLDAKAVRYGLAVNHTLEGTLKAAVDLLGAGAARTGGETQVPLLIWQNPGFQSWYRNQVQAGNKLVGAKMLWSFKMPIAKKLFCFVLHADVYVASEDRVKSNEFMFTRSDISCVVAYVRGTDLLSTRVLTIREFRTPARTPDGFVHELPGGSSLKDGEDPRVIASHELEEETGLTIDPERFHLIPARQLASTLSTHVAHVFAVEITEAEAASVVGTEHGVAADTEHTYVGLASFEDIITGKVPFDFSMIGMIGAASLYPTMAQTSQRIEIGKVPGDVAKFIDAFEAAGIEGIDPRGVVLSDVDPVTAARMQMMVNADRRQRSVLTMDVGEVTAEQLQEVTVAFETAVPKVFLGGTCANSTWREDLIERLRIDYFNPVVADWTPECQAEELRQRETCDFVLYVITPRMEGVYSIAEVVDDANRRPEKTVFCVLDSDPTDAVNYEFTKAQRKSLKAVEDLVRSRGARVCGNLGEVAAFLNGKAQS